MAYNNTRENVLKHNWLHFCSIQLPSNYEATSQSNSYPMNNQLIMISAGHVAIAYYIVNLLM